MPTRCDIVFDNSTGVYYGGQQLSGTVNLTTQTEKTIRAIHIEIFGYAKVRWTETKRRHSNGKTRTYTETYTAHEQYLASRTYVLGEEGGNAFTLEPRNYNYAFRCALPPRLPTSFHGIHGHIRYEVILTIDRPFRFDNVFKQGFTVISQLDLNVDPRYRVPNQRNDEKEFCCCCSTSGSLKAQLSISFSGYVPGQKLHFTLFLDNESNNDISHSTVVIRKDVTYEARHPHVKRKHQYENVAEKDFGLVLRLTRKEFRDHIVIPPVPPTTLGVCQCIKINYMLYAEIESGPCHTNLTLSIPITIGSIPLVNIPPTPPIDTPIINQPVIRPTAPLLNESNSGDNPPGYEPMIPPSYEQAMAAGGFVDPDEGLHTKGPFVPKYPVYHNYSPSAPSVEE